jgi:hypothetical protein
LDPGLLSHPGAVSSEDPPRQALDEQ